MSSGTPSGWECSIVGLRWTGASIPSRGGAASSTTTQEKVCNVVLVRGNVHENGLRRRVESVVNGRLQHAPLTVPCLHRSFFYAVFALNDGMSIVFVYVSFVDSSWMAQAPDLQMKLIFQLLSTPAFPPLNNLLVEVLA